MKEAKRGLIPQDSWLLLTLPLCWLTTSLSLALTAALPPSPQKQQGWWAQCAQPNTESSTPVQKPGRVFSCKPFHLATVKSARSHIQVLLLWQNKRMDRSIKSASCPWFTQIIKHLPFWKSLQRELAAAACLQSVCSVFHSLSHKTEALPCSIFLTALQFLIS